MYFVFVVVCTFLYLFSFLLKKKKSTIHALFIHFLTYLYRHSEDSDELIKEILKFKSFITDTNKRRTLALAGHSPYTDISQLVTKSGASKRPAWTTAVNSAFQQLLKDIKRVLTENCIIPITELDFYEEYDFFEELG